VGDGPDSRRLPAGLRVPLTSSEATTMRPSAVTQNSAATASTILMTSPGRSPEMPLAMCFSGHAELGLAKPLTLAGRCRQVSVEDRKIKNPCISRGY
jgi:hypothetical protein